MNQPAAIEALAQDARDTYGLLPPSGQAPADSSSPTIRYLAGFVKPKPAEGEDEPDFATVAGAVAEPPGERRFVTPAVWHLPAPTREAFVALQRWEGIVVERRAETFLGRLTDLTADGPQEEVELPLADIPAEDLVLVELGAVFYWSIGYRDELGGQRWRASTLRFRRLPVWSQAEIEQARSRARDVARALGGD